MDLATTSEYVYGSVAEKINEDLYDPYEQNAVLKSKKTARSNSKIKTKIVFIIFIIFGMCSIIMFRFAQISQLNYESNKLSKQYVAMMNENELLKYDINKATSLENIREVAENKLKMHKPDKSQIVYVNIPKEDLIILANKEESKYLVMFKDVTNNIKKFLNIFY